jgi:DNA-binding XRE family transcriptional regulator
VECAVLILTSTDLAALIRDRRKRLKLNQSTLAKRIGVSRQWVIEVEHGHPRAEIDLELRTLDELDIHLDASSESDKSRRSIKSAVDINAILTRAKGGKA